MTKETLRKFPSVPVFAREIDEDLEVTRNGKTFTIPKGAICSIPCYKLHRDERHWKDPEEFDPAVSKFRDAFVNKILALA